MKPLSQINVIPFIDIMLVLLAVVLTTATFVAQGKIPVTLPSAGQAKPLSSDASVEITIDDEGRYYLGGEPRMLDTIATELDQMSPRTRLLLRVDENTPFRHFVAVVDLVKARGLENLSIATRRGGGG
jgi:biopolymer transport protein ExbD